MATQFVSIWSVKNCVTIILSDCFSSTEPLQSWKESLSRLSTCTQDRQLHSQRLKNPQDSPRKIKSHSSEMGLSRLLAWLRYLQHRGRWPRSWGYWEQHYCLPPCAPPEATAADSNVNRKPWSDRLGSLEREMYIKTSHLSKPGAVSNSR